LGGGAQGSTVTWVGTGHRQLGKINLKGQFRFTKYGIIALTLCLRITWYTLVPPAVWTQAKSLKTLDVREWGGGRLA
jgi:hypothetical protein